MEIIMKQMSPKQEGEEIATVKNENHRHNLGLRALLSMRNCNITLKKEYDELLEMEAELDAMNKIGMLQIATHCNPEMQAKWKEQVN